VQALEAFLADIYGDGRIFAEHVIPRSVVTSSPHFCRPAFAVDPRTACA